MEERFEQTEKRVDQHGELIVELRAATLKSTQNIDRLMLNSEQHGEQIAELRAAMLTNTQNLDRLTGISERFINVATDSIVRLDQNVTELRTTTEELRASNQRQERINDYLIRRDQERDNGNPG
jgi:flagellar biosynthesis/type III secretory pathway chaperone